MSYCQSPTAVPASIGCTTLSRPSLDCIRGESISMRSCRWMHALLQKAMSAPATPHWTVTSRIRADCKIKQRVWVSRECVAARLKSRGAHGWAPSKWSQRLEFDILTQHRRMYQVPKQRELTALVLFLEYVGDGTYWYVALSN